MGHGANKLYIFAEKFKVFGFLIELWNKKLELDLPLVQQVVYT